MKKRGRAVLIGWCLVNPVLAANQLVLHNETNQKIAVAYALNERTHVLYANPHWHVADLPAADELNGTYRITQIRIGQSGELVSDCTHLAAGQPYLGVELFLSERHRVISCEAKTLSSGEG